MQPQSWLDNLPLLSILIIALFAVGFLIFFLIVAMIEKRAMRPLTPVGEDRLRELSPRSNQIIAAAMSEHYRYLGCFSDGAKGWCESVIALLLSEDGLSLLWVQRRPTLCRIITALKDGMWLISSDTAPMADFSGMRDEEVYPDAPFQLLQEFHAQRLMQEQREVEPFTVKTILDSLLRHLEEQARRTVLRGLGRYRSPKQDCWSFTARGAIRQVAWIFYAIHRISRKSKMLQARLNDHRLKPVGLRSN